MTRPTYYAHSPKGSDAPVDFVIEHHGTFDEERIGKCESRGKLRLAMENRPSSWGEE